jgi:hypothetical protein
MATSRRRMLPVRAGNPSDMDDDLAQTVEPHRTGGLPVGGRQNRQRSAALDERERHLDRRETLLARRERANDLRDLAADRYGIDEDLYPAMDD